MSQLDAEDSDCYIDEQNVTYINLDDSQNENADDDVPPPPPSCILEPEDGELVDCEDVRKEIICEIKFPNRKQFELVGPHIIDCVKEHISKQFGKTLEIVEEISSDYVKLIVQELFQNLIEDIPMPPPLDKETAEAEDNNCNFDKETSPDLSGISELFKIDTAPSPKIDSVTVPSYKRAIKDALLDEEAAARKKQKQEESIFRTRRPNSCFNCGETGHSIRECSKPHNAKRIKNAKRACYKAERYHVDVEQRFAHLKPGIISDNLREALGLKRGEIPFFFYRMRVLGYPPGWLEDAKVEQSGINLFNSDGTKILHSDEDEGEVEAVNHKYNISKIYDFPGFNQNPGKDFFDDYMYHNVPPLDKRHMKEEFIKTLGDNILKGYKRKKLKDFPNATAEEETINKTVQEATDMEIEDPEATALDEVQFTRPPPPADQPPTSPSPPPPPPASPPPPPPASPPTSCESPLTPSESRERELVTPSPSLMDLEKQKQLLLQELQANITVIDVEDSLIDEIIELDADDDNLCAKISINNAALDKSSDVTEPAENKTTENKNTVIKKSIMGTPLLSFSPYDNLPNGENFKVGVSDVINFENLPDSTGKYEQMKNVIKKVRSCLKKIHSE